MNKTWYTLHARYWKEASINNTTEHKTCKSIQCPLSIVHHLLLCMLTYGIGNRITIVVIPATEFRPQVIVLEKDISICHGWSISLKFETNVIRLPRHVNWDRSPRDMIAAQIWLFAEFVMVLGLSFKVPIFKVSGGPSIFFSGGAKGLSRGFFQGGGGKQI
jgi:hypothetical protein